MEGLQELLLIFLSAKLGFIIPGEVTIPDLIDSEKEPYYMALRHADAAFASGALDISLMEELMSSMLANQLLEIHKRASLSNHQGNDNPVPN